MGKIGDLGNLEPKDTLAKASKNISVNQPGDRFGWARLVFMSAGLPMMALTS